MEYPHQAMINITEEDIPFEEDILRNPFSVRSWLRYIAHKGDKDSEFTEFLYERAVKEIPGSYKLWKKYLDYQRLRVQKQRDFPPGSFQAVNFCYERALRYLSRMPRIWLDYCEFLMGQGLISRTRRTFDLALRALPVTQHHRIWNLYVQFVKQCGVVETCVRVYRRYLKVEPRKVEEFIDFLLDNEYRDEAAKWIAKCINDDQFSSLKGKTTFQLWSDLCDLVCGYPKDIKSIRVEAIIRAGISRFSDQVGRLWVSLARYFVIGRQLEKARDVFEEAMTSVTTVRDFSLVFDAYVEFEESIITSKMESELNEEDSELDLRLARLEHLMDRRPFLISDVLLRQNPHNVLEWSKRIQLYEGEPEKIVETYTKALATISTKKVQGRLQKLWIDFAKYYEDLAIESDAENPDLEPARKIFEKSLTISFKHPDNLAECYIAYAEMEMRNNNLDRALQILGRGTAAPNMKRSHQSIKYMDDSLSVQQRVFKSLKLWAFYADVEEAMGTIDSCKAVYERMMDLKIVTPQIIMNYALFLEENKYFEDSFKVYQRGIDLFGYPIAFEIWNVYLQKFIDRYGGTKLERARDIFEQALDKCPSKFAKVLYILYAKLEEEHGLAKRAMEIYDRATSAVLPAERYDMFVTYITKAITYFGLTYARPIYEKALEVLPDKKAKQMAEQYIDLEVKLGEIDRARAIYGYASQFSDPRLNTKFWETWHEFEVRHGNEETYKEMLRVKRSIQAQFSNEASTLSAQLLATNSGQATLIEKPSETFVSGGTTMNGKPLEEARVEQEDEPIVNEDEIKIDYVDDDDQEVEDEEDDDQRVVPASIPVGVLSGSGINNLK